MNVLGKSSKLLTICLVVVLILLSYIKFFTLKVSFSNDPTVAIVKTKDIQWGGNTYKIHKDSLPYNWYDDYGFKILKSDEMGYEWQCVHSFMITIWWIMLFFLVEFNVIKLIKKKARNYKLIKKKC